MKKQIFWLLSVLLIAGGAINFFLSHDKSDERESSPVSELTRPALESFKRWSLPSEETAVPMDTSGYTLSEETEQSTDEKEDQGDILQMFQVDARDNLVLNESARFNVEKLHALNSPEELEIKIQEFSTALPPPAHKQLIHYMTYFDQYIRNVTQSYPAGAEAPTIEDALDQMRVLHNLRVLHFGTDVAATFFAQEERSSQQLVQLIYLEKDTNLTATEKTQKQQELVKSYSGL